MSGHLLSSVTFGSLTIEYDDRVLTPRSWTEMQSRWAAELAASRDGAILELCTGAGHIGLLAAALAGRPLVAVDVDPDACRWFRRNAESAGLSLRATVRQAALVDAIEPGERFAVVVADPPWVTTAGVHRFPEDPVLAIDGGRDGLAVARECVAVSHGHLERGASLLVQLGDEEQARALVLEATDSGWTGGELRCEARGVVQQLLHP